MNNYLLLSLLLHSSITSFVTAPTPSVQQIISHPRYDLAGEDDYIDEITHGHRVRDKAKHDRQNGCLCLKHFQDPHCGSDGNEYDNGCFFLCAQQKQKGLRLRRWGNCDVAVEDELEQMLVQEDTDFDDVNNIPLGYVEI